jgi:hypothetical protein
MRQQFINGRKTGGKAARGVFRSALPLLRGEDLAIVTRDKLHRRFP